MNKTKKLQQIKIELHEQVIEDLGRGLLATQKILTQSSPKRDFLIHLRAQYNRNKEAEIIGNKEKEGLNKTFNTISVSIIEIISTIKERDILPELLEAKLSVSNSISYDKKVNIIQHKLDKLEERLIRIKGTDISMEFRLEEEINDVKMDLEKLKNQ